MSKITIEFFHDVICSFCFPMSYRMRKLQEMMPDIEIIHRSFALVKEENHFDLMFGDRANAKEEILGHWVHANQNDDLHRFNIEGMKRADFPFPSSMNVLKTCKAAYFIGGDPEYWNVFDALQKALFVENRNIGSQTVIYQVIRETGVDFELWKQYYEEESTEEGVESDLRLAELYGIRSIPHLVINGKYRVSGAQSITNIFRVIEEVKQDMEA
ncbi:DsbA family protein [Gudongella oleilytica]|uniref:DsbA family oxidoreductase n=1 Tax=Gudongella oleilytica TaxID=1582259 RepID=UPI002A3641AD|nr:DsbA family protein [Gudongella oleilytica]MDY0258022.1 DsbA family protein [Gudongella oleilytica]